MKSKSTLTFVSLVLVMSFLVACAKTTPVSSPTMSSTEPPAADTTTAPVETSAPTAEPTSAPEVTNTNALPPDPKIITITTEDNFTLTGYYYPAAVDPAPLVVLFHWKPGSAADWNEIAPWLQNRGLQNPFPNPGSDPWWDASWFPAMPADKSYGVLTITFRGCKPYDQGGCANMDAAGWMLDTQAVMVKALELTGENAPRIVTIGASIGADAAADGCQYLNQQRPGACKGALSLSPGNYLSLSYVNTVQQLGIADPSTPAWCIADPGEFAICKSAEASGNSAYQDFSITDGNHGNMLLSPDLDPLPIQLILDFLDQTLE